jgi:hypothetical protein
MQNLQMIVLPMNQRWVLLRLLPLSPLNTFQGKESDKSTASPEMESPPPEVMTTQVFPSNSVAQVGVQEGLSLDCAEGENSPTVQLDGDHPLLEDLVEPIQDGEHHPHPTQVLLLLGEHLSMPQTKCLHLQVTFC